MPLLWAWLSYWIATPLTRWDKRALHMVTCAFGLALLVLRALLCCSHSFLECPQINPEHSSFVFIVSCVMLYTIRGVKVDFPYNAYPLSILIFLFCHCCIWFYCLFILFSVEDMNASLCIWKKWFRHYRRHVFLFSFRLSSSFWSFMFSSSLYSFPFYSE